jgi:hypothetical protein
MSKANPKFRFFLRRRLRRRSPEILCPASHFGLQQRFAIFDIIIVFSTAHFSHLRASR